MPTAINVAHVINNSNNKSKRTTTMTTISIVVPTKTTATENGRVKLNATPDNRKRTKPSDSTHRDVNQAMAHSLAHANDEIQPVA